MYLSSLLQMGFGGSCCGQFVKYSMFVSNFIIFVSVHRKNMRTKSVTNIEQKISIVQVGGAVLFGLGLWTLVDRSYMTELLGTNLFTGATYVLIITSALVCVVSFFGCLGAAREVKCMLLTVRINISLYIALSRIRSRP